MARGFLGTIIKVSKAIDAANKRAAKEAQKRHNQAIRIQKATEREYFYELKKQQQENDRRFKEEQLLEKKLSKAEEVRRKEQFNHHIQKSKENFTRRCDIRQSLRESYIRKILK